MIQKETERVNLRWQGRWSGRTTAVTVEIYQRNDGRLRIHIPPLHWEPPEPPYRKVEDAKREAVAIARKLHHIDFPSDKVVWEPFDGLTKDAPAWKD